jgi:hypothetical protein
MEEKPRLAPELVEDFVRNSHGDFERVNELIEQEPALVNATWDWGRGDWETGLGAASHVGSREIALFLLEHGARMDLFAATMLGKLEIVKATIEAFPEVLNTPGPHGIPLIVHAQMGGEDAEEVLEYLQALS